MTYLLLGLNSLLMVSIPIGVAILIRRKTRASWRLFFIGAATFILSQVFHIPFNWLIEQTGWLPSDLTLWSSLFLFAAFYGLSAGVFEETARYLTYRFWAKDARTWSRGMMLGAGHGGIEAILLGLLVAIGNGALLVTANSEALMSAIPADQQSLITDTVTQIFQMPWYELILGAVERVFAIAAHLAMSVMVLQVFLRRSFLWLFLSIGYHAALNATALIVAERWGALPAEGALALFGLLSVFIIFRLRTPDPVEREPGPLPSPPAADGIDLTPTDDAVDRSRFS